mgnify:CR=1 FL=1
MRSTKCPELHFAQYKKKPAISRFFVYGSGRLAAPLFLIILLNYRNGKTLQIEQLLEYSYSKWI